MPGTLPLRRYDLVICDIDGCLVSETTAPFDLASLAKVRAHNERAIAHGDVPIVTLCTGRPQPFAEAVCRLIGNTLMPCVCEMGVWVYDPGPNTYIMDPRIRPEHLAAVRAASEWAWATWGSEAGGGVTQQPGKAASVTLYHPDTRFLTDEVFPSVRAEFAGRGGPFRVSMTWFYINCDLAHVSKGTGLDRMLSGMNLDRARIAGIGDTLSDKCIADRVGFFACPANAAPGIKEHAHYIAKLPEAGGVVEILEHLSRI